MAATGTCCAPGRSRAASTQTPQHQPSYALAGLLLVFLGLASTPAGLITFDPLIEHAGTSARSSGAQRCAAKY